MSTRSCKRLGTDFQSGAVTPPTLEFRMMRRDGTARDVEAVVSNQTDRPSVAGYVANIRDVTERKKFEALLALRALHDPLTGTGQPAADPRPGRSRCWSGPGGPGCRWRLYFIDLDNFKDSNDSLGHGAGDKLLQMVAGRLLGILRSGDTVGRLGGDEFVILAEGVSFARGPEMIAERVHEVLKPRLPSSRDIDGIPITVSASIGIAVGDRPSAEDLLRDADIALYRAKGAGRDQSVLFEHSMQSAAKERLSLKSDLDARSSATSSALLYHPIFDLEGIRDPGRRGAHPLGTTRRGAPIDPDAFIPVLEERGLIVDVGRWVLRGGLSARRRPGTAEGHQLSISVNVSMRQLETDRLVDDVRRRAGGQRPRSRRCSSWRSPSPP